MPFSNTDPRVSRPFETPLSYFTIAGAATACLLRLCSKRCRLTISYCPIISLPNSNFSSYSSITTHHHPYLSPLPPSPSLRQIERAHAQIIAIGLAQDDSVTGRLLAACALSPYPSSDYSRAIFDRIRNPNVLASNNIIRCYAKSNSPRDSMIFYNKMRQKGKNPNNYTFPFLLQACSKASVIAEGMQIHAHIVKFGLAEDIYIRNALIHFYGACHAIESSRQVFDECPQRRDLVSWNAILAGYAKLGQIEICENLFGEMPERDVISWSTIIMGYVQGGQLKKGLDLFREMRDRRLSPNEAILVTVLSASGQLCLLEHGRLIHATIKSLNFPLTVALGAALVDMYAKCGCIEISREVFNAMPRRDVFAWNAMICGLATHGLGKEALALFQRFVREGFQPVNVTFIGVLSACSRAGLVEEGRNYFKMMKEDYGIEPEMEHYGCIVDLLSRAGFVVEAIKLIEKMTIPPDPVLWGTLLAACKMHGLVALGEVIGEKVIEMEPTHDGYYVLLAGIYASARRWEDVTKVRRLMVSQGAHKIAGWSLIEAQGRIHRFVAGDREHERSAEIYEMIEEIGRRLAAAGYFPDVSSVLHDIGEEEKENAIWAHSERLAIAFGLLVSEEGSQIRIVKNLRVCGDCHEVSKTISKVFRREIVVRDGSRFHHFREGSCSCFDYW